MTTHKGKLTKTAVDGWAYKRDDPILWDGKLTGFGVKANKGGSKSYIVNYRNKYNAERRYAIGKHGGKLTADMARDKADKLLARIRLEQFDPLGDKQETHRALSVNQMLDKYLLSAKFDNKTPRTQNPEQRYWTHKSPPTPHPGQSQSRTSHPRPNPANIRGYSRRQNGCNPKNKEARQVDCSRWRGSSAHSYS